MKKGNKAAILVLIMTVGLLGAVVYFSILLSNSGNTSVTRIKKTKASAITYSTTKLLALNSTPIPSPGEDQSSSDRDSDTSEPVARSIPTTPIRNPSIPVISGSSPVPSVFPTVIPTIIPTSIPTSTPYPKATAVVLEPTAPLLSYRNPTITPTLIPVRQTGGSYSQSSVIPQPTKIPTLTMQKTETLPETGFVQYSSILFIVAVTTLFISFLF